MTKECNKCTKVKELSEFHKQAAGKDGVHSSCKVCCSIYNKNKVVKLNNIVLEHFGEWRCHDCGITGDPAIFDCDHMPEHKKLYQISLMIRFMCTNPQLIRDELAKCQLVCANCHRMRTKFRYIGEI